MSGDSAAPPPDAACATHPAARAGVTCHRCGSYACTACVFSTAGTRAYCHACAAKGLPKPVPWERRAEIGWVRAFLDTTKLSCLDTKRFARTPRAASGAGSAMAYGVLAYGVGQLLALVVTALLFILIGGAVALLAPGPAEGLSLGMMGCIMLGMSPLIVLQAPFYALLGIVGGGALTHGTLHLLKKTRAPFEDTLRAVSYSNAPYLLYAVPLFGPLVATFGIMAIEATLVRDLHGTSSAAAWLAVAGYRILFLMTLIGLYAAIIAFAFFTDGGRPP